MVIDKPLRLSSMGVIRVVRRRADGAKTGHAGTLDPLATGVLIVCIGKKATRSVDQLMGLPKRYIATVDLSAFTTTDDAEGERDEIVDPQLDTDAPEVPTHARIVAAAAQWTGNIMQTPPAFSAIKVGGRRAYRMARGGEAVELSPRPVRIDQIDILEYTWPLLTIDVRCGKGTYIRSLARDLGRTLNTGGSLSALQRTEIGPYTIDQSIPLDDVPDPVRQSDLLPVPEPAQHTQ
ncbi:MAG: tRNA pseudouridine(55) synthase TruB [Planctomycetota bacterium]